MGPPPAKGTVRKLTSSSCLSSSIDSDGIVPVPGEATLSLPGLAFIKSINSSIVLAGNVGFTRQGLGGGPRFKTGDKFFFHVKGNFFEKIGIPHNARRRKRGGLAAPRRVSCFCLPNIPAGTADVFDVKLLP